MKVILAAFALLLVSCGTPETLSVRQFHLRDTEPATGHKFIRAEMNKRLYGAVSEKDRQLRRGHYYDLRWHGLSGKEPVKVRFEYRQARTGSRVKRIERVYPASISGNEEIWIRGADYRDNGRVLSWKVSLFEGSRLISKKQSFLWE